MVTKIIHYCWFGGVIPNNQKEYIEGWSTIFPDYKVMHWNEDNIPKTDEYVRLVLAAKKWAFLSDYVRLYALYHYGGLYLDTDVKVLKNFEHEFDGVECLFGFESELSSNNHYVGTAVIAAEKNSPLIREFLGKYDKKFGKMMSRDDRITGPKVLAPILQKRGLCSAETQNLGNIRILKRECFYPNVNNETEIGECYTIHDWAGSWRTEKKSLSNILYKKKRKMLDKVKKMISG